MYFSVKNKNLEGLSESKNSTFGEISLFIYILDLDMFGKNSDILNEALQHNHSDKNHAIFAGCGSNIYHINHTLIVTE